MSDSNSDTKIHYQLEADYRSSPVDQSEANLDNAARELQRIIQRYKLPIQDIQGLLLEPENIPLHQDLSVQLMDQVFQLTEDFDPFELQKLSQIIDSLH